MNFHPKTAASVRKVASRLQTSRAYILSFTESSDGYGTIKTWASPGVGAWKACRLQPLKTEESADQARYRGKQAYLLFVAHDTTLALNSKIAIDLTGAGGSLPVYDVVELFSPRSGTEFEICAGLVRSESPLTITP